jgi:hypothetical protein
MTDKTWVRHLKAEDVLNLQSLMLLLAGRDMEERESAFKGILEILNPVVVGVRSMEAVKPAELISKELVSRDWSEDDFLDYLFYHAAWGGSSQVIAKQLLCDLLTEVKPIDDHAASMLSDGFDRPSKYWLDIQAAYDKATGLKK